MSGKGTTDTLNKVKSTVGQQFLTIIGKSSSAVEGKKEKKVSKERCKVSMAALSPWYNAAKVFGAGKPKTVGELGWLQDEHDLFATGMQAVEAARKADDYKRGADLADKAKQYAESLDLAKVARKSAETEIDGVRKVLSKNSNATPERTAISNQIGVEAEALRRGDPPDAVLLRVRDLKERADKLVSGGGGEQTQRTPLDALRLRLANSLGMAIHEADVKLRELATKTLPETTGILRDMEVSAIFNTRVSGLRASTNPNADEAKLPDDEARMKDLQRRYDKAVKELPAVIKTITSEIEKNKGKDFIKTILQGVEKDNEGHLKTAAREKFVEDYKAVETALAGLADILAPTPPELATAVAAAKKQVLDHEQYDKGEKTVATMLRFINTAREEAQQAASVSAGTLATDLNTLRTDVAKQAKASPKRVKLAYAALSTELGQLDVIVKTNNTTAFGAARERMEAIRKAGVTDAPAILRFNETVDAIETITSDKVVAKEFESDANDIALALNTVLAKLSLFELAAAQKTMNELKRDADKLQQRANALGPWRVEMKSQLQTLAAMIKEFHKLMPKAEDTTFELNYNKALAQYDKPGVDPAAVAKLVTESTALAYPIINNLREAGPTQTKTINALETDRKIGQASIADEAEKQRLAQEKHDTLKADLKTYKDDLDRATELVKTTPNGDKDELSELKILGDQAVKKFKGKDEDGAASQLKSIRKRLDALLKTPGGVTAESVGELANVENLWSTAMGETRTQLDAIAKAAGPAAEAARVKPEEIKAQIDSVYDRLQPFKSTLVRSMKMVADEKSDIKTRKAEREYALRDLRGMRAVIDGNPLAAKLATNPFGIASPFAKLRRFLADMEYNAMRAVPPE